MRARSRARALSSDREGDTSRLLPQFSAVRQANSVSSLIQLVCRKSKAHFGCDSVGYWELERTGELVLSHCAGKAQLHGDIRRSKLAKNLVVSRAFSANRAVIANRRDLNSSLICSKLQAHSCLVVPVGPKRMHKGVLVFARRDKKDALDRQELQEAEFIAALLGAALSSLARTKTSKPAKPNAFGIGSDLKPSLLLPDFARDFTARAADMLGARMAFLALNSGTRLEMILAHEFDGSASPALRSNLEGALTKLASEHSEEILKGSAAELLGEELGHGLKWSRLLVIRLAGREGSLLGVLCLVDVKPAITNADRNLIHTIAGYASVALENSRLFSRIEQSKRQWVEDFDAIHDLIVVHDPANRIVRINRSLAQILGAPPSELIGVNMNAFKTFVSGSADGACAFCGVANLQAEGSALSVGTRAYLISTSRIGAGGEEGSRIIHVLKDITEQRSYQAQLKRERDFNTKILNHTQNMILVLDTAGLISYANHRCYEAGFRENEFLGRPLAQFVPRNRRSVLDRAFQNALQGSISENLELPLLYGNRSTGQFSISLSPMRDESGEVNSVVVVMTDITDARVLQAQLRHSEKMAALGQLVSGVAHEINNPLASIIGYSDLLLESPQVPEQAKEELNIVLKEAERTKEIVQNLLRFARQMPARRERLDVHSILQQVVQLRAYGAANEGVQVVEPRNAAIQPIIGDADQIQQVFLNILNNAYDAVRDQGRPGRIDIRAADRDDFVEITVRDNGTGVADTERVFEPFYTTKEVGKGTGLGLSICYGIVREHGGEITCVNNSDGPGCTFLVRLPAANVNVSVAEAAR